MSLIKNYVISVGRGRTFEFVPALSHLGVNFCAEHYERKSRNCIDDAKLFLKLVRKIRRLKNQHPDAKIHLIILENTVFSFLLSIVYAFTDIAVIIRIRSEYFKQLASQVKAVRIKRVFAALLQLPMLIMADKVIVISAYQAKRMPVRKSKMHYVPVIRETTALPEPAMRRSAERPIRIITVSNFNHWQKTKGTLELIQLFDAVHTDADVRLEIYGKGRYSPAVASAADKAANVEYKGFSADIEEKYRHSDAFVYGSFLESFGASLLEARLFGLPCAILDYAPLREQITNIRQIIPADDFTAAKEKLLQFIEWVASGEAGKSSEYERLSAQLAHSPESAGRSLYNCLVH